MLVLMVFPGLKTLPLKGRIGLMVVVIATLILNVAIKRFYSLPFFLGTASTDITYSFSSAISYFFDGILSILQINSGPEYLVGIPFSSLSAYKKLLVILILGSLLTILILYLHKTWK